MPGRVPKRDSSRLGSRSGGSVPAGAGSSPQVRLSRMSRKKTAPVAIGEQGLLGTRPVMRLGSRGFIISLDRSVKKLTRASATMPPCQMRCRGRSSSSGYSSSVAVSRDGPLGVREGPSGPVQRAQTKTAARLLSLCRLIQPEAARGAIGCKRKEQEKRDKSLSTLDLCSAMRQVRRPNGG